MPQPTIGFITIAIISYLGLAVGTLLANISKEELSQGKKYFSLIQDLLLAIILFFLLYFAEFHLIIALPLAVILFFISYYLKTLKKPCLQYSLLGLFFFASSFNKSFFIIAVLVFMLGLTASSITYVQKKSFSNNLIITLLSNLWFFLFSLIPYLIYSII